MDNSQTGKHGTDEQTDIHTTVPLQVVKRTVSLLEARSYIQSMSARERKTDSRRQQPMHAAGLNLNSGQLNQFFLLLLLFFYCEARASENTFSLAARQIHTPQTERWRQQKQKFAFWEVS